MLPNFPLAFGIGGMRYMSQALSTIFLINGATSLQAKKRPSKTGQLKKPRNIIRVSLASVASVTRKSPENSGNREIVNYLINIRAVDFSLFFWAIQSTFFSLFGPVIQPVFNLFEIKFSLPLVCFKKFQKPIFRIGTFQKLKEKLLRWH